MCRKIAVIGAGLMGAGIVQVSIDKGYDVVMKDTNQSGLYRGIGQIQKGLDGAVKRKRITRFGFPKKNKVTRKIQSFY